MPLVRVGHRGRSAPRAGRGGQGLALLRVTARRRRRVVRRCRDGRRWRLSGHQGRLRGGRSSGAVAVRRGYEHPKRVADEAGHERFGRPRCAADRAAIRPGGVACQPLVRIPQGVPPPRAVACREGVGHLRVAVDRRGRQILRRRLSASVPSGCGACSENERHGGGGKCCDVAAHHSRSFGSRDRPYNPQMGDICKLDSRFFLQMSHFLKQSPYAKTSVGRPVSRSSSLNSTRKRL